MYKTQIFNRLMIILLLFAALAGPVWAEDDAEEEKLGPENETDLSLVITEGNSSTETLGFKNTFRYHWPRARYRLRLEGVRSNTAADRYAVLQDSADPDGPIVVVEPGKEPDVERYLVENRYDRLITERFFWNAGLTWDRNLDAGILSRWVAFAGVGNIWWDRDDLRFNTTYGFSYTDREEDSPDPLKDDQFMGIRFNWGYLNKWGKVTTFTNDWTVNANVSDFEDWSSDMISSISVGINSRLAMRVSLQWLYNHIPALVDVDLFHLEDGVPIPERRTVPVRQKQLDTTFSTSLVVNF